MSVRDRITVSLHYDFASTLCYVAHRVFERISPALEDLGLELAWTPIDLAGLLNWKRGHPVSQERRANAARVSRELGVPVKAPRFWIDSRTALALGLRIDRAEIEASWRERIFSSIFETGSASELSESCLVLAAQLGIDTAASELAAGLAELEKRTRQAAEATVVGAPTLMLAGWPIAGIQKDDVMLSMLERYASRVREDASARASLQ